MATRHEKEKGVNVQVLLRCRPFSDDELRSNAPQVITCNEYQREVAVSQNIAGKQIDRVFTFDKVFGPTAQQKDLYEQAVVPIVNEVLEGFNCTIFAYGQTGTGKTYTMEGECRRSKSGPKGQLPPDAGVIPRAVKQIFDTLEGQHAEYSVKITFLELYNEEITDLLAPEELSKISLEEKQKKSLPLMEDGKGGVLVRGLEEEIVTSASEIFTLLERGSAKRRTAETLLNKQSSRSHSLFSITIHIKEATPEGEELIKCGKLNLVDLAGSENICRSGAREGRAREAGEINKSLLTLGRVITALVEHLGHIPYRDSKLTRLLRDSLGGRTKTCIIATVSPSVHCLEETLSTLDYAHRAKNIKNRPEVNQKMMKSALIKDLYGEIDRLKAEVYATREKNGVYIPKERYYQEESERKAMAEQIELMESSLEANQKQIEELQDKYDTATHHSFDLSIKLESAQKHFEQTSKQLAAVKDELKKSQYALQEREYVIFEQKKAENALAHQACLLRSDLDKSIHDVSSLFLKIDREEKLNVKNRSVVNNYQIELAEKMHILCSTVTESLARQNGHLHSIENLCHSCVDFHDKSFLELKKKVESSRTLFVSHNETLQNIVRLHKAGINAGLEEMSSLASSDFCSVEQLLTAEAAKADNIFNELQATLSHQQGEIAHFSRELRERCHSSLEFTKEISDCAVGFLDKLGEESRNLQSHVCQTHVAQTQSISDFQKAYEEQSKSMEENLLDDISKLVSRAMHQNKELVNEKLVGLRNAAIQNKTFMDEHASSMKGFTSDAKRKWEAFSKQTENHSRDTADFSAAKHCQMEQLVQQCVSTVDIATKHLKRTHESVNEIGRKHVTAMESLVRNTTESNEQHDDEIGAARIAADQDIAKSCEEILQHFESVSRHEQETASAVLAEVETHSDVLRKLQDDHQSRASEIEQQSHHTFGQQYMDYEPAGCTPTRCELELPTKEAIDLLRAMPMEALVEDFRETHPYEPKEPKPSLIPRSPLIPLN